MQLETNFAIPVSYLETERKIVYFNVQKKKKIKIKIIFMFSVKGLAKLTICHIVIC